MATIPIHLIEADGRIHDLQGKVGQSLMRAAVGAGSDGNKADSGGLMTCATCHVYVEDSWADRLPVPSFDENSMLDMTAAERRPNSRLSCQIVLDPELAGLTVSLPDTQY
jgi:2Fe-2S ferredoxin